jgi:hypothetical protein
LHWEARTSSAPQDPSGKSFSIDLAVQTFRQCRDSSRIVHERVHRSVGACVQPGSTLGQRRRAQRSVGLRSNREPVRASCSQSMTDLGLKLKTGHIRGDCVTVLRDAYIPEAWLKQAANVMDAQRRRAVNTVQFVETEPAFADRPLSVAVTRHTVAQTSNQLHRLPCCWISLTASCDSSPRRMESRPDGWPKFRNVQLSAGGVMLLLQCMAANRTFKRVCGSPMREHRLSVTRTGGMDGWLSTTTVIAVRRRG